MVKKRKYTDLDFIVNYRTINNIQFLFLVILMPFVIAIFDALDDFNLNDYMIIPSLESFIAIEIVVILMFFTQKTRNIIFRKKIYPNSDESPDKFENANLKLSKLKAKYSKDEYFVDIIEKVIIRNDGIRNNK